MFTKLKFDFIATVGRVEIKTVNDREMAKLRVAANSFYTDDAGEKVKRTHWVECVAWNPPIIESIKKHVAVGATLNLVGEARRPGAVAAAVPRALRRALSLLPG